MKHTPLYDQHVRDASTVINLKGFARAMQYRGHVAEHRATREHVSLCDVSHMGELDFKGADALALVQKLITNDAARLAVNQALYSVMCDERGIVIDDLVCYRLAADHFVWVVNVTKTDEDYQWVLKNAQGMDVKVSNVSTDTALLALQGPESREALQRITKADLSTLKYYWLAQTTVHTRHAEVPCVVSRTGYTGERGYEIMVARDLAPSVWDELLMAGRPLGIVPQGVAARESLRTEAGYLLNGNDMDAQTNPIEAGLEWVVRFSKEGFIGKDALAKIKAQGVGRRLVGLELQGHRTVRNGYPIYASGKQVGKVTSGPLSPALSGRNLGLGYVATAHARIGTELEVAIGDRKSRARVVATQFCERRVKEEPSVSTFSPYDLRFSDSHVWARVEEGAKDVVVIGLSDFGQRILGDILCVDLPKVGDRVTQGSAAAWVDSYRRPLDVVSPVTGEVVAIGEPLVQHPERINAYPYARTGLLKVRVDSPREIEALMPFEDYAALIQRLQRYDEWFKDPRMT
ncbi:MAG TPA: glycine cleavage system aminomethyltransferase GcvT [Burkholderiales bacterium]|jgi:aminomethyltransferase|nr:glycine cleavage system aminomethyltransferase GcvT [Burkholderiales bacterium]